MFYEKFHCSKVPELAEGPKQWANAKALKSRAG